MVILNSTYKDEISDSGNTLDISNFGVRSTNEVLVTKFDGTSESTLVITTDYTIDSDLTTVTLNSSLTSGQRATATLNIEDTQTGADYKVNGSNNAGVLENALDKIVLNLKKKQERLDRVLAKQLSDTTPGLVFASFENKANFYTKVNSTEDYIDFSSLGGATFWNNFTLPVGDGSSGETLYTNGSGTLDWADPSKLGNYRVLAKLSVFHPAVVGTLDANNNVIYNSYNVSSLGVSGSAGSSNSYYTLTFTNPPINNDYLVLGFVKDNFQDIVHVLSDKADFSKTTTSFDFAANPGGTPTAMTSGHDIVDMYFSILVIQ